MTFRSRCPWVQVGRQLSGIESFWGHLEPPVTTLLGLSILGMAESQSIVRSGKMPLFARVAECHEGMVLQENIHLYFTDGFAVVVIQRKYTVWRWSFKNEKVLILASACAYPCDVSVNDLA